MSSGGIWILYFLWGHFPTSSVAPSRRAVAESCGWEEWVWDEFPVSRLGPSSLGTPFSFLGTVCLLLPLSLHGLRFKLPPPPARLCPGYERNCVPWWTHGPSPVIPGNGGGADLGDSALPPVLPWTPGSADQACGQGAGQCLSVGCCSWHRRCHEPALGSRSSPCASPAVPFLLALLLILWDHLVPFPISFFFFKIY